MAALEERRRILGAAVEQTVETHTDRRAPRGRKVSQVFDGLLLPIILVFVMLLARDPVRMGSLRSSGRAAVLGWAVTITIGVLSVALVASQVLAAR